MDDTNPETEDMEYVQAIQRDVRWLGFDWGDRMYYASDYYPELYACGEKLVEKGKAYVCDLSAEEVAAYRGTITAPGKDSPYRNRSVEENLALFRGMRDGKFPDGSKTLRAKIDMAHPNLNLRDPVLYRVRREHHYRTGDQWCIYPMYDYAHPISDALEKITHSLCTLEFEHHRPLYDWFLTELGMYRPQQIEFARLNLTYTLMSKRKLMLLVDEKHVAGWDDPRMPTLSGMRRRGYTPSGIRKFVETVGVAKFNSVHEWALLEHVLRDDLNATAARRMAVLRPLKLVITDLPDGQRQVTAVNNPEDAAAGTRQVPFSRVLWIERDDFREEAPKKWFRLSPGKEVRLRYACIVRCVEVVKDQGGAVVELRCTHDPATWNADPPDGRKVKGVIHWVSAAHGLDAEVRLYEHLFTHPDPEESGDFRQHLNPRSLEVVRGCKVEPSLRDARPGTPLQFERLGYFCADADSKPGALVFNRTIPLKDTWSKIAQKEW
jgi:glutaminyl-tRNA synthetase